MQVRERGRPEKGLVILCLWGAAKRTYNVRLVAKEEEGGATEKNVGGYRNTVSGERERERVSE
jgi:hypothetical protein